MRKQNASARDMAQVRLRWLYPRSGSATEEMEQIRRVIRERVKSLSDSDYWKLQGRLMDTMRMSLWSDPDSVLLSEVMLSTGAIPAWALRDLESEEPLTIFETQDCDDQIERDENASPLAAEFRQVREEAQRQWDEDHRLRETEMDAFLRCIDGED